MPGIQSYPAIPRKTSYPLPKSSMTAIYYLALFFCILTVSAASPEEQILMQDMQKTPPPTPELKTLKQFLEDGQIIPFYEAVNDILQQHNRYDQNSITEQELADSLFLCYLIASAPFIDITRKENTEWIMMNHDLDYSVKDNISRSIPYKALIDKTSKIPEKEAALHLYLSSLAVILKQFRNEIDPDFETTRQHAEKIATTGPELIQDADKLLDFYNILNTKESRSNTSKAIVPRKEKIFIKQLLQCFPTKALQVKKYLRMAGYDDKEIPALLDRTIGRVPAAAYLYKGLPTPRK